MSGVTSRCKSSCVFSKSRTPGISPLSVTEQTKNSPLSSYRHHVPCNKYHWAMSDHPRRFRNKSSCRPSECPGRRRRSSRTSPSKPRRLLALRVERDMKRPPRDLQKRTLAGILTRSITAHSYSFYSSRGLTMYGTGATRFVGSIWRWSSPPR